ncbi:MAG: C39 family peptidase [Phormidium sp. BM_Day4_Bin.17]|nr:C39 family peptidase [Phormidium sp. BM_Day4_Bin.17]UCJ13322.1 MAG: C39 family peptidase [Phormidium sp. PBR-2020]
MGVLTYLTPQQVLINTPTVLEGTYDPQQIAKVSVAAEDRFSLPVTVNPSEGLWRVQLNNGFNQAGIRWFRLKGTNGNGQVVGDRTFHVTVSQQPLIEADDLKLTLKQRTWFKAAPIQSNQLADYQKIRLEAGETLRLRRYTLEGNHLGVELESRRSPVGTFGYLYEPHTRLEVGGLPFYFTEASLPEPPSGTLLLWVTHDTRIKQIPESSTLLSPGQQAELLKGQVFFIRGYACVSGHYRVSLVDDMAIPGFGNSGFLYNLHVRINQDSTWLAFDPNQVVMTILRQTHFKTRPADSATLSDSEKVSLPATRLYGVERYEWEASYLKLTLTENFPGFGQTGYVSPDFVEFQKSGRPFLIAPTLNYTGPNEVLVKTSTTLTGRFDRNQVTSISVVAEDKFSLPVTLNASQGTWQVRLNNGFQDEGLRWLRLRGTNANGATVHNQIIYITVTTDSETLGEPLTLRTRRQTWFKVAPRDSASLGDGQKLQLQEGLERQVEQYAYIDGHLQVRLTNPLSPIGPFGYLFEPHVELRKGDRPFVFQVSNLPEVPAQAQLLVTHNTHIKTSTEPQDTLPANVKARLLKGQSFRIRGYASIAGHFRVTLTESIPGFGNIGYVFWQHVELIRDGKSLPYDPEALTVTMRQQTVLKRRPIPSGELSSNDRVTLPLGRVYGVSSYETHPESKHVRVALTEELPGYGNTGYLFADHVWVRRGADGVELFPPPAPPAPPPAALPSRKELNVPYFSQRDNPEYSWATCNPTSAAMVLYYYGVRPTVRRLLSDELFQWIVRRYGIGGQTDHGALSAVIRAYGFRTNFSTRRRWAEIDKEIAEGRPVVLPGYFTATGHVVTVIGYTPSGLIVNDPWGNALTGYRDTYGARLFYPNGFLLDKCGRDGDLWAHFIYPN